MSWILLLCIWLTLFWTVNCFSAEPWIDFRLNPSWVTGKSISMGHRTGAVTGNVGQVIHTWQVSLLARRLPDWRGICSFLPFFSLIRTSHFILSEGGIFLANHLFSRSYKVSLINKQLETLRLQQSGVILSKNRGGFPNIKGEISAIIFRLEFFTWSNFLYSGTPSAPNRYAPYAGFGKRQITFFPSHTSMQWLAVPVNAGQ